MRIQITSIGDVVSKTSAKGVAYKQIEVKFLANGRAGKRQIMSFNKGKVYETLLASQEGQEFEITTVEDGEYTNWASAVPVSPSGATGEASKAATSDSKPAQGSTKFQSTYETPEERAKKQVYIVRQSSIGHAISFCNHPKFEDGLSVEEVLRVAKQFEAYVFGEVVKNEQEDDTHVEVE